MRTSEEKAEGSGDGSRPESEEGSPRPGKKKKSQRVKQNKRSQGHAAKDTQSAVQLCAFMIFVEDFMKSPGEEGYRDVLEEGGLEICDEAPSIFSSTEDALLARYPDLVQRLFASLVEEDQAMQEGLQVGERDKEEHGEEYSQIEKLRPDDKTRGMERRIVRALVEGRVIEESDLLQEEVDRDDLEEIRKLQKDLRRVIEINNRNKRKIREARKMFFGHFELIGLLRILDGRIESVYSKRCKNKKKKRDDESYFMEMESLLEKRSKLLDMCRHVPVDFFEIPMAPMDLEEVELETGEGAKSPFAAPNYF